MKDFMADFLAFLFVAVMVVVVFAGWYFVDRQSCIEKTQNIGLAHDYGLFKGCLIETSPGVWIPLENWRMFGD